MTYEAILGFEQGNDMATYVAVMKMYSRAQV